MHLPERQPIASGDYPQIGKKKETLLRCGKFELRSSKPGTKEQSEIENNT
jgi:hypothetical protein